MNSKKILTIIDKRTKVSPELDRKLKNSITKTEKIVSIKENWDSAITVLRNGVKVDLEPPFCLICGAHMGEEYSDDKISNPHGYELYGNNACPKCGRGYEYLESDSIILSNDELDIIRRSRGTIE